MADNTIVHYSGTVVFYQGAVAAGATLSVYNEDTLDLASIWTDRDLTVTSANPVTADANGNMPFAYIGTQAYKVILKTSGGTTIDEEDDIPGALNTSGFSATFAKPDTDITAKTADYTIVSGDVGTIINCNPTGGTFQITMISAVTAGNGRGFGIMHKGTANVVKAATVSSQTITGPLGDSAPTAFCLTGYGEYVYFTSDGANWIITAYVPPILRPNGSGVLIVKDRVSAAPSSSPGSVYICNGAFSTFELHDVLIDNGQGGLTELTPATDCGWIAYVQDEDIYYYFRASAWVAENASDTQIGTIEIAVQSEMEAASSTTLAVTPGRAHFHPGVVKAWAQVAGDGSAISADYGVASITDNGTGDLTVTVDTAFSATTSMVPLALVQDTTEAVTIRGVGLTTTTARFLSEVGSTGTDQDPTTWFIAIFGDL